jgi:hypothetical protein
MMYLVNLDNTPGFTLTVTTTKPEPEKEESETEEEDAQDPPTKQDLEATPSSANINTSGNASDIAMFSAEAQRIIDEARAKLEALSKRGLHTTGKIQPTSNLAAGALLVAATTEDPSPSEYKDNGKDDGGKEETGVVANAGATIVEGGVDEEGGADEGGGADRGIGGGLSPEDAGDAAEC